jgi:hypothetical protein
MTDLFLKKVRVSDSNDAIRNSLRAALNRNKTYKEKTTSDQRATFRSSWAMTIIATADSYNQPVSDQTHCDNIERVAVALTRNFKSILVGERLRFGTSQKAFNLYLKFQWRLGIIPQPPHCPVDGVVLRSAHLSGYWTKSDSVAEYMDWITALRAITAQATLAEWEYDLWNRKP